MSLTTRPWARIVGSRLNRVTASTAARTLKRRRVNMNTSTPSKSVRTMIAVNGPKSCSCRHCLLRGRLVVKVIERRRLHRKKQERQSSQHARQRRLFVCKVEGFGVEVIVAGGNDQRFVDCNALSRYNGEEVNSHYQQQSPRD